MSKLTSSQRLAARTAKNAKVTSPHVTDSCDAHGEKRDFLSAWLVAELKKLRKEVRYTDRGQP